VIIFEDEKEFESYYKMIGDYSSSGKKIIMECSFDPSISTPKIMAFNKYKEEMLNKDCPISEDGITKWIKSDPYLDEIEKEF